jgi:hypothetical protein
MSIKKSLKERLFPFCRKGIMNEIIETVMEKIRDTVKQKVQDELKQYQDTTNKKLEKNTETTK